MHKRDGRQNPARIQRGLCFELVLDNVGLNYNHGYVRRIIFRSTQGAPFGVRVNSVAPGHVETPIYGDTTHEELTAMTKITQLIGRPIQSEEVRSKTERRTGTTLLLLYVTRAWGRAVAHFLLLMWHIHAKSHGECVGKTFYSMY